MKYLTLIFVSILCCLFFDNETKDNLNNFNNQVTIIKKLTEEDIRIYKSCLDTILVSDVFRDLSSEKKKIVKVSSSFSISAIINFSKKVNFKSNEEIKVFSKLIDDQNYLDPNPKMTKIGRDKYSNFLVEFSKPNDKYITAFIQEIIYRVEDKVHTNESVQGFIIFYLEDAKIVEHHHSAVILETY